MEEIRTFKEKKNIIGRHLPAGTQTEQTQPRRPTRHWRRPGKRTGRTGWSSAGSGGARPRCSSASNPPPQETWQSTSAQPPCAWNKSPSWTQPPVPSSRCGPKLTALKAPCGIEGNMAGQTRKSGDSLGKWQNKPLLSCPRLQELLGWLVFTFAEFNLLKDLTALPQSFPDSFTVKQAAEFREKAYLSFLRLLLRQHCGSSTRKSLLFRALERCWGSGGRADSTALRQTPGFLGFCERYGMKMGLFCGISWRPGDRSPSMKEKRKSNGLDEAEEQTKWSAEPIESYSIQTPQPGVPYHDGCLQKGPVRWNCDLAFTMKRERVEGRDEIKLRAFRS